MDGMIDRGMLTTWAGRRLRDARLKSGYRSAAEFARLVGVNITTYQHHEIGRRGMDENAARLYSQALGVSPDHLLMGHAASTGKSVRVWGYIEGDGKIVPDGTLQNANEYNDPMLDTAGLHCLVVRNNGLFPAYRRDDWVYHAPLRPLAPGDRSLNGIECVCEIAGESEFYIRQIIFGMNNRVTLIGYSTPPMTDVVLVAASPVLYVRRHVPIPD